MIQLQLASLYFTRNLTFAPPLSIVDGQSHCKSSCNVTPYQILMFYRIQDRFFKAYLREKRLELVLVESARTEVRRC